MNAPPAATVVINTHNRRDEVVNAVRSACEQVPAVEVLVIDDGSTDGTAEVIREQFSNVRIHRFDPPRGYIEGRNHAASIASAPVVCFMDDDAVFTSADTVARVVAAFDEPRVGVVAIPYIDVNKGPGLRPPVSPPDDPADWYVCPTYTGTAHAVRRDTFLKLGGYRTLLFHQGEERDYALRLLAAGGVVRLADTPPIHHMESPSRDRTRVSLFGRRNDVLFVWHNAPARLVPREMARVLVQGLRYGFRTGRVVTMARGLIRGIIDAARHRRTRRPVPDAVWRLHQHLSHHGPLTYRDIADQLPAHTP